MHLLWKGRVAQCGHTLSTYESPARSPEECTCYNCLVVASDGRGCPFRAELAAGLVLRRDAMDALRGRWDEAMVRGAAARDCTRWAYGDRQ